MRARAFRSIARRCFNRCARRRRRQLCTANCLAPTTSVRSLPRRRVGLKRPLSRRRPRYTVDCETGGASMSGDGLDLLKPFLPGLEAVLDRSRRDRYHDERAGQRTAGRPSAGFGRSTGPRSTRRRWSGKRFISPGRWAWSRPRRRCTRCRASVDGSRSAICVPPASSIRRHHRPAVREASVFRISTCVEQGVLRPTNVPSRSRADAPQPPEYPRQRLCRQRQDGAPQRPHRTARRGRTDRRHRGLARAANGRARTVSASSARAKHARRFAVRDPSKKCGTHCGTAP